MKTRIISQDRYLFLDFSPDRKCYWLLQPQCVWLRTGQGGNFFLSNSTDKSVNAPECSRASFLLSPTYIRETASAVTFLVWSPHTVFVRLLTSSLCCCVGGFYTLKEENWRWYYKLHFFLKKAFWGELIHKIQHLLLLCSGLDTPLHLTLTVM